MEKGQGTGGHGGAVGGPRPAPYPFWDIDKNERGGSEIRGLTKRTAVGMVEAALERMQTLIISIQVGWVAAGRAAAVFLGAALVEAADFFVGAISFTCVCCVWCTMSQITGGGA